MQHVRVLAVVAMLLTVPCVWAQSSEVTTLTPAPLRLTLLQSDPTTGTLTLSLENLRDKPIEVSLRLRYDAQAKDEVPIWGWGASFDAKAKTLAERQQRTITVKGIKAEPGMATVIAGPPPANPFSTSVPFNAPTTAAAATATWTTQVYVTPPWLGLGSGRVAAGLVPLETDEGRPSLPCVDLTGVVASSDHVLAVRATPQGACVKSAISSPSAVALKLRPYEATDAAFDNAVMPGKYEGTVKLGIRGGKPEDRLKLNVNAKYEWYIAALAIIVGLILGYGYRWFTTIFAVIQPLETRRLQLKKNALAALDHLKNAQAQEDLHPGLGSSITQEATALSESMTQCIKQSDSGVDQAIKNARAFWQDSVPVAKLAELNGQLDKLAALADQVTKLVVYRVKLRQAGTDGQIKANSAARTPDMGDDAQIAKLVGTVFATTVTDLGQQSAGAEYLYQFGQPWLEAFNQVSKAMIDVSALTGRLAGSTLTAQLKTNLGKEVAEADTDLRATLLTLWNPNITSFDEFRSAWVKARGSLDHATDAVNAALRHAVTPLAGSRIGSVVQPREALALARSLEGPLLVSRMTSYGVTITNVLLLVFAAVISGLTALYFNNPTFGNSELFTSLAWGVGAKVFADNAVSVIPVVLQALRSRT